MEKGFFKVFIPEISAKRLGWKKIIKDNIVELGDFFIFDYDGTRIFYFKLLGRNGCEKEGAGGLKHVVKEEEAEEMNVEHQKSVEPKVNTRARDSKNISSSDVKDGNNMVEKKMMKIRNVKSQKMFQKKMIRKKKKKMMMMNAKKRRKRMTGLSYSTKQHHVPKLPFFDSANCKSATAGKVNNPYDQFSIDIFRSGRATKPKYPYFVTKICPDRRNHPYIPADVVRDYQLEIPSSMTIRDSAGREFEAKLKIW
ncbi:hypothetical protein KY290_026662 [Solanum tuberosum]|uniref:TF-B3 domain-containing protein n=1 Tax=Solanum tuberosum TaxID=4113 RepID=A0ABQ7UX46_SOLTU|nr:hypothetical protein KY284_024010 [Solanum tuberosum]KAH0756392.1 hypothetical protein KY290_026662 [Solanum tuberosum]